METSSSSQLPAPVRTPTELELIGRRSIWGDSLHECEMYLLSAARIKASREQPSNETRARAYVQEFHRYLASVPIPPDGLPVEQAWRTFSELHPPAFPFGTEVYHTLSALRISAAIAFTRIFTTGDSKPGVVGGQRDVQIQRAKGAWIRASFPDEPDYRAFRKLEKELMKARNTMLAHSDGEAQELKHLEGSGTVHRSSEHALRGIDDAHWLSCVVKLQDELWKIVTAAAG